MPATVAYSASHACMHRGVPSPLRGAAARKRDACQAPRRTQPLKGAAARKSGACWRSLPPRGQKPSCSEYWEDVQGSLARLAVASRGRGLPNDFSLVGSGGVVHPRKARAPDIAHACTAAYPAPKGSSSQEKRCMHGCSATNCSPLGEQPPGKALRRGSFSLLLLLQSCGGFYNMIFDSIK